MQKECTMGRMTIKSTRREVQGQSLLRSLVRSHRSLIRLLRTVICLLRTARFARALCSTHSFACPLTYSFRSSWESLSMKCTFRFHEVSIHSASIPTHITHQAPISQKALKRPFLTCRPGGRLAHGGRCRQSGE